ncbi:LytR family transcriptional regulator [Cellulomonas denverensis]|uniref:LytR family transcriptional regulator n=1 Tax=Cellulomonas denverensis TaxID=264297 RepID=A0A7X6KUP4_9CELL|nr:LytR family transcriptional regulator [Cellulomonas denverensis]
MLRGVALGVTTVLLATVSAAAAYVGVLDSGIDRIGDVDALVQPIEGDDEPVDAMAGSALNILVLGSDDRSGANRDLGGEAEGMRSDTAILLHIAADRSRAELVSIPRDSLVEIPSCTMTDGSTSAARSQTMFNEAYAIGADQGGDLESAVACTINTVQQNTGLRVTDSVVVDMNGFVQMIDALGGVRMCLSEPVDSPKAGLSLAAGDQTLDGRTALAFARARYNVGDGSDTSRVGRQQQMLAAVFDELLGKDVLSDAGQLLSFGRAATSALSMSERLTSLPNLAGLATSLRGLGAEDVTFTTVPWTLAPQNKARVVWTEKADILWANLAADRPMLAGTADDTGTPSTAPSDPAGGDPDAGTPSGPATRDAGAEPFTAGDTTTFSC